MSVTAYGSVGGQYVGATGMWASKDGAWNQVPLGEPPPPPRNEWSKWSLADWAGTPIGFDANSCWPAAGWATYWNGNDLCLTHPAPQTIWLDGWAWAFFEMPPWNATPDDLNLHPHGVYGNPADATHWSMQWRCTNPDLVGWSSADWGHLMAWLDMELYGDYLAQAGVLGFGNLSATLPIQPELLLSLDTSWLHPTPPAFTKGEWVYATMAIGDPNNIPGYTFTMYGDDTKWGWVKNAATRQAIQPISHLNMSHEFRRGFNELMTRDIGDLDTQAQVDAVTALRNNKFMVDRFGGSKWLF